MATLDRLVPPSAPLAPAWKPRRALAVALISAAAIALLQVFQSSSSVHTGRTLQLLQQEEIDLSAGVHTLEAQVAALASLDHVERAAGERLGLVPAKETLYLAVAVDTPRWLIGPPSLTGVVQPAPQSVAWWQRILRLLPFD